MLLSFKNIQNKRNRSMRTIVWRILSRRCRSWKMLRTDRKIRSKEKLIVVSLDDTLISSV